MKKIILPIIVILVVISTPLFAQWGASLWGDSTTSGSNQSFGMQEEIQQETNPSDPGNGDGTNPPQAVPIDGGLIWLLAAGAGYGAKRIHENHLKRKRQ